MPPNPPSAPELSHEMKDKAKESMSINIYELIPSEEILAEQKRIGEILFGMSSGNEKNKVFYVSPVSGCISFADHSSLFSETSSTSLPTNSRHAEMFAKKFVQEKNIALAKQGLPSLLPLNLQTIGSQVVYSPLTKAPDHWLVRFNAYLQIGGDISARKATESEVLVAGGLIDLRVGADGRVIGLCSRWRPYRSIQIVKQIPPELQVADQEGLQIIYKLEGDNDPQRFIAPYYIVPDYHEGRAQFIPASSYSLTARIDQRDSSDGIELVAVVAGNTGRLLYAWGCWRIDSGISSNLERLDSSSASVIIGGGTYNVVVEILDQTTGAIARTETVVHSRNNGERNTS